MIWGAFSGYYDKCFLFIVPSSRTTFDFVNIVYEGALCDFYFLHNHPNDMILIEHGAPMHCISLPKWWKEAHGMSKLDWPSTSLDLNSIENLWKIMKDHIQNEYQPQNMEQTIAIIQHVWERISKDILDVLISIMPHKMKTILDTRSDNTR